MARSIVVSRSSRHLIEQTPVELCEHKGIGHPDTLTDAACEAASRGLSLAYLERYGQILHHNLDKGLLIAGRSRPRFGGGRWLEPIRLTICGAATRPDADFEVPALVRRYAFNQLNNTVPLDTTQIVIEPAIAEGSDNLKQVFSRSGTVPLANDTSFGVGFAPHSRLETCVLRCAEILRAGEFRRRFPAAGHDFKVMGHRIHDEITLTVALAFIDRHVDAVALYFQIKQEMAQYLLESVPGTKRIHINTLDDTNARDESGIYLTVSGLSAEMGDCGQVGRGNRVNGLITPGRCMSLEAAAGKNPVTHVGKLYNVLAMRMAHDIHAALEEVGEVHVQLLSAIGRPIDDPQIAAIELLSKSRVSEKAKQQAYNIADDRLRSISEITQPILQGKTQLY